MLSAAHVLAMDAKNLLDVVDSIRVRFPQLFSQQQQQQQQQSATQSNANIYKSGNLSTSPEAHSPQEKYQQVKLNDDSSNCYQSSIIENYQNLSQIHEQQQSLTSPQNSLNDANLIDNQQQMYSNQQQQQQQQTTGIYDNDIIINHRQQIGTGNKPLIAAKPINLGNKIKSTIRSLTPQLTTSLSQEKNLLDEQLKIIEDDVYANSSIANELSDDRTLSPPPTPLTANNQTSTTITTTTTTITSSSTSNISGITGINLPEPVPCSFIQENLLANSQKIISKKLD